MKKMKSYILSSLFFASFVFNFSNAMHVDNIPLHLEIPGKACRSLLFLGTGIAGLVILTATIKHIINNEKEHNNETLITNLLTQALSLRRHSLGIGTGILFLATGFWGLKSKANSTISKTLPSCQSPKPKEK